MIVGTRTIGIRLNIAGRSLDVVNDLHEKIEKDFIKIVKDYERRNSEEARVSLAVAPRCGNCGKEWPKCLCGRPTIRPIA